MSGSDGSPATADERPAGTRSAAAWIYSGLWSVLVEWFRVPRKPPTLPARDTEGLESFQPAIGFLRYLKWWFWITSLLIDVVLIAVWIAIVIEKWWLGLLLLPLFLFLLIVPDVLAYIAIHLRYDTTWFVMTDRSLRIRRGAWVIREMTITFENVQNVRVGQGPIQRLFGIAHVEVETAGSGGGEGKGTSVSNRAVLEGLTDAARIRDLIMARLQRSRSAGLGDEDHPSRSQWTSEHLQVLREIRDAIGGMS
ncbi:MAG: PH domain-containing protein [Planctomycetota bacterium]|jgi:membrane protein YdbS with pleckstrin-like domain